MLIRLVVADDLVTGNIKKIQEVLSGPKYMGKLC